jgi:alkanesulfonate monooxygenase SsuD/methylene tetrahydromethanopterin reductase-like flavin-dependent oxidoreductase (luciferase family)
MQSIGIELGIRAPLIAVRKAAIIADAQMLNYYFVPETHPKFIGVNAFEALQGLAGKAENVILGTGIVNIFSRSKEQLLKLSSEIYYKTGGKFVLGLGTSTPVIIENMYGMKFEKPVSRIMTYTDYIKSQYKGPIFWAVVGDKITNLAAEYTNGVIFFLKPESEIRRTIKILRNKLSSLGRDQNSFEIISILPTYIDDSKEKGRNALRMTIANYVGANKFYSIPLEKAGYKNEVRLIRENFIRYGLIAASEQVSEKLVEELSIFGGAKECAGKIIEYSNRTKIKTVVSAFDLPRNSYNIDFFKKLHNLVNNF